mmetsp:Transcript_15688/g.29174  ORF Transcript_15688/g.29174 Transcript_15688/m.29174 type:complete len:94 (-) Transcript_15688:141-422(-)
MTPNIGRDSRNPYVSINISAMSGRKNNRTMNEQEKVCRRFPIVLRGRKHTVSPVWHIVSSSSFVVVDIPRTSNSQECHNNASQSQVLFQRQQT